MTSPAEPYIVVVGPPRLDGTGASGALLRRALARRELRDAAAVVVLGPLTAGARDAELAPLRGAFSVFGKRVCVLPSPADLPAHGRPSAALAALAGDMILPRVIPLAGAQMSLITLDTLRLDGGRNAIGVGQLAGLETWLAARPAHARTILALAHHPGGDAAGGPVLTDGRALAELVARHPVDLVLHGQRDGLVKGRWASTPTLAPPPLLGCRLTGWRALLRVSLPEGDAPEITPIHFARPADRPALAEAFGAAAVAEAWTGLAERIVAADDTFAAVAQAMRDRAVRARELQAHGAALDDALVELIRRAGEPGEGE